MWWWARLEISWCEVITAYCLPKQIYKMANTLKQVVLLDIPMLFYFNQVNWLFSSWKKWITVYLRTVSWTRMWYKGLCFIYEANLIVMYDGIEQLLQTHCNRFWWANPNEMKHQCIILITELEIKSLYCKKKLPPETATFGCQLNELDISLLCCRIRSLLNIVSRVWKFSTNVQKSAKINELCIKLL